MTFVPYSGTHIVTLCVCAVVVTMLIVLGRALRKSQEAVLRRALAFFGIVYWISYNAWWSRNELNLATGLPLHICDVSGLVGSLALLTLNRWLRATLYFWSFALTTQAFIQPGLVHGPPTVVFWLFWSQHTIIVACAVYDLGVLHFRPDWLDLGRAYAVSAIYLATVVPLNQLLSSNYGFVGNPPPTNKIPPFVDLLGPWPQRALIVVALAAIGFVLLALPWQISKQRRIG